MNTVDPSSSVNTSEARAEELEQILDDAAACLRRGENVSVEELTAAHPKFADDLRELFPALEMIVWTTAEQEADAESTQPRPPEVPGNCLGDFRLICEIGRGGMGVVYEAEQLSLRRRVALKVLPFAAMLDKRYIARFESEACAAATLHHPNIVPIFAVGCDRGVHFYAMQLIDGRSVAELLSEIRKEAETKNESGRRKFSTDLAPPSQSSTTGDARSRSFYQRMAHFGVQAAEAIEYSHSQGILHRDIKPGNLLIDNGGKLWVTDFGLARTEADARMTVSGDVIGTLRYISPEQLSAKHTQVDCRTDVYALGATLYEMFSMKPAFDGGDRVDLLRRIVGEEPLRLRQINPRIPQDLETIVGRAMEKNPAERYESARELADDLRRFLDNRPINARRASSLDRATKWASRHERLVAGVGLAFVVLSVLLLVSTLLINRSRLEASAALSETADLLYVADMTTAFAAWEKGWLDEVQSVLKRQLPRQGRDLRGWEWFMLDELTRPPESTVYVGHEGSVNEIAVFPDRRRLASVGNDGTLRIWDLVRHTSIEVSLADEELHSVAITPDGKYVAAGGQKLYLWNAVDHTTAGVIFHSKATIESLAFCPDGKQIAVGSRYTAVSLLALDGTLIKELDCASRVESLEFLSGEDGLLVPNRQPHPSGEQLGIVQLWRDGLTTREQQYEQRGRGLTSGITLARSSPCGTFIATGELRQSRLALFHRASGKLLAQSLIGRASLTAVAYSPSGDAIAIAYSDGVVECFDLQRDGSDVSLSTALVFKAHESSVTSLQFIDSDKLASCATDGLIKIWDIRHNSNRPVELDASRLYDIALSPDGSVLACASDQNFILLDNSGNAITQWPSRGTSTGLAWSPSGDRLVTCGQDAKEVVVYDQNGKVKLTINVEDVPRHATYSPDGQLLAIGSSASMRVFSALDGRQIWEDRFPAESGRAVACSHDGCYLAYGGQSGSILIGELQRKQTIHKIKCPVNMVAVAFSPNDALLATGHADSKIRIWKVSSGKLQSELTGHALNVHQLAFSPDGRTIISASMDGTIRTWSVAQGRAYGPLYHAGAKGAERDVVYCDVGLTPNGPMAIGYWRPENRPHIVFWKPRQPVQSGR